MATEIWAGSAVRFSVAITNASDVAVDPSTLKIDIMNGNDIRQTWIYGTDAEVVKDSTGNYHCDYTIPGPPSTTWRAKWTSTGTGAGADINEFVVLP